MLNIFPTMFLALLAHALLRVFLSGTLAYLGLRHLGHDRNRLIEATRAHWKKLAPSAVWALGLSELLIAGFLFVGAFTQIAALALGILSIKMLFLRRTFGHPSIPSSLFYVLTLGISISLFITGAGAFAIDLPL